MAPDTPPANHPPAVSHRKGGRPPNSRKGKLGKNQYTKDRDLQEGDDQSPGRSQSRDVPKGDENGNSHKSSIHDAKSARSKNNGSKITMSDMKKRASGLLDFISRTQIEMAKESLPGTSPPEKDFNVETPEGVPAIRVEETPGGFEKLSCTEMMDVLAKKLIKWQNEFG